MADHKPSFAPACSNTLVQLVSVRPDWLDVSVPLPDLRAAVDLWGAVDLGPSAMVSGGPHYAGAIQGDTHRERLSYGGRGVAAGLGTLRIPGAAWAASADPAGLLARLLAIPSASPSRIDLAADFEGSDLQLLDLCSAFSAGDVRTRAREGQFVRSGVKGRPEVWDTFYVGSEKSPQRVRAYNMRGPVRVEYQARHLWAQITASQTVSDGACAAHLDRVGSYVDFPTVGPWRALRAAQERSAGLRG